MLDEPKPWEKPKIRLPVREEVLLADLSAETFGRAELAKEVPPPVTTRPGHTRRALFGVSWPLMCGMLSRPGECVRIESNDLPADARVVNVVYDWNYDRVVYVIESDQLPEVPTGSALSFLHGPVFRTIPDAR